MQIKLYELDKTLRHFFAGFVILLVSSSIVGLVFVYHTTQVQSLGISERYAGSQSDEFEIQDSYPKPVAEMLLNTHNHLFGFSFIFVSLGFLFYFNSKIKGTLKYFIIVEPFLTVFLTFGGLWLIRFLSTVFVYFVIVCAVFTYAALFLMAGIILYELLFQK